MFFFTYTAFFLSAACFTYASFIFWKKRDDILARYFALHVYAVAIWIGANAFADLAKTPNSLIFWSGIAFIGVSFFVSYYLCFAYIFIHKKVPTKPLFILYFLPTVVFCIGAFSKYSVVETIFPPGVPSQIIPGVFYTYHLYFFIFALIFTSIQFVRFLMREHDRQRRLQAFFMETGFFILFAATVLFGIILPLNFNELRFFNLGPQFAVFLIAFSSYAILKHRLFDIQLIIKKGAIFTVLFGLVFFMFVILSQYLSLYISGTASLLVSALLVTLIFSPLKFWLEKTTDQIFYRNQINFADAVSQINRDLVHIQKVDELTKKLSHFLKNVIKVEKITFLIVNEQGILESRAKNTSFALAQNGDLINYINANLGNESDKALRVFEKRDLQYRADYEFTDEKLRMDLLDIKTELEALDYDAAVTLSTNGRLLGIVFLGGKLSGDNYGSLDFRVLETVSHEVSIALENALNVDRLIRLDELKSEFIRVVSHQLLTPLVAARWNMELLFKDYVYRKVEKPVKESLTDTHFNLVRLNDGLNDMLTVMAIAENKINVKREKVNFTDGVLNPVLEQFESRLAKKNIKLKVAQKNKTISGSFDQEKLKKVVSVLISNAIAYSPEGSQIDIYLSSSDGALQMAVEDQALGVPKANRNEIFEKFFRGEEAKKLLPDGLGVNLYISRYYVTLHGGRLWVEDRADKQRGSRFIFNIPLK